MKPKSIIITAGIFGVFAVIMGAMGAHALKEILSPATLQSYLTGARYNMYHALALLAIAANAPHLNTKWMKNGVLLIMFGTVIFSGSIYLLATSTITGISLKAVLGPATPIGGLLLITGWISIAIAAFRK
tara:strand:+ start:29060 stop:29449 length:390 start_codon:yes stop_codon:yes gene_type:complete